MSKGWMLSGSFGTTLLLTVSTDSRPSSISLLPQALTMSPHTVSAATSQRSGTSSFDALAEVMGATVAQQGKRLVRALAKFGTTRYLWLYTTSQAHSELET